MMIKKIDLFKMLLKSDDWKLTVPFGDPNLTAATHRTGAYFYIDCQAVCIRDKYKDAISEGFFRWILFYIPASILECKLKSRAKVNP
ncbi:MAG: hypothetical protein V3V84_07705 [Candidatus Bathyarchaeia archaeon]